MSTAEIEAQLACWVEEEMATLDLGDVRRDRRLKLVVTQLGAAPSISIPAACGGGRAETEGAYRLLENDAFGFEDIIEPHIESTLARIRKERVCILPQDTTEIDLTRPHQQVKGTGPMDAGPRRGCFLHPTIALTENGISLGTVHAKIWAREETDEVKVKETPNERRQRLRATPIEDKESIRWLEGIRVAHGVAEECPETQIIAVSDSESDIFELFVEGQAHSPELQSVDDEVPPRADWIVRACHDRAIVKPKVKQTDSNEHSQPQYDSVYSQVKASPVVHVYEIDVRGRDAKVNCETRGRRQPRNSRTTKVEVRSCRVNILRPKTNVTSEPNVVVNAVLVTEIDPPEGDEPIEWLLLTSLPIDTEAQVQRVISVYCLRWEIEIFFRVLKQGCRIEQRLFESVENFKRYLGVALIISWRTLQLSRLGRETPDISCETVFEPSEWKSVYQVTQKKKPPKTPPTLGEIVRMVAQLGGYVNRHKNAYPGPETIWKGLVRMYTLAMAWDAFGPEQQK